MNKFAERYFLMIRKCLPAKVVRPTVGLDIGFNSCRMLEVVKRPDRFEVVKWGIQPVVNGDIASAIRTLLASTSVPSHAPVTAISGKGTLIRFVDMPKMSLEDLKKSFAFEVDKYFPFPKDQIFTDCCIIDPAHKDNKMSVLVAAAKRDMVQARMKLMGDAGLQADFITLNSIAVANVFNVLGIARQDEGKTESDKSPGAVAVLDIGEIVSTLMIFVGGKPRFNRDIFIGGRDFTKTISTAMRISFEDAEKLKRKPGPKLAEVMSMTDSLSADLVSELRLSFDYFVTETNVAISQFLLTGGASAMETLPESLSKHLEISAKRWNPFERLQMGPGISSEELHSNSNQLSVALGLALYS